MSQLHLHHNHYTVTRNVVQCRDKLCLFRGEKSRIHFRHLKTIIDIDMKGHKDNQCRHRMKK